MRRGLVQVGTQDAHGDGAGGCGSLTIDNTGNYRAVRTYFFPANNSQRDFE